MSRPALRAVAVAGAAALTFAAPASAFAAAHGHAHQAKAKSHQSHKHHGKPAPQKFTAVGTVVSVDAGTVTINDKGGSKDLHGQTVTVVVSSTTKVTRDDAPATLADLQAGDHVAANGTRGADKALNASHVNAESAPEPEASETPSPDPSDASASSTDTSSTDTSSTDPSPTDTSSSGTSSSGA